MTRDEQKREQRKRCWPEGLLLGVLKNGVPRGRWLEAPPMLLFARQFAGRLDSLTGQPRFGALAIQAGTRNPSGIAHSIIDACRECLSDHGRHLGSDRRRA